MTKSPHHLPVDPAIDRSEPALAAGMPSENGDHPRGLYRVAPWVVVRTPALPAEQIELARHPRTALDNPSVLRALAIGAPDLLQTLQRPATNDGDRRRAERSLARYLIRMSTRPTPFGAFAGVSLASWSPRTTLTLGGEQTTRTRPDTGWVIGLLRELEADPEIRAQCRWRRHPLLFEENGRFLTSGSSVSIRASAAVRAALSAAAEPVAYEQLCDQVRELTQGTKEQVADLLAELWRNELLQTDLRPQLTGPAATSGAQVAELLRSLRPDTAASMTTCWPRWRPLIKLRLAKPHPASFRSGKRREPSRRTPTQCSRPISGSPWRPTDFTGESAPSAPGRPSCCCALRRHPSARQISAYARSFFTRYGEDREASLPELFDPVRGLGPMPHTHGTSAVPDPARAAQRADTLQDLALSALHDGRRIVELDDSTIAALQTWRPRADEAPISLDLAAFVVAAAPRTSTTAISCSSSAPTWGLPVRAAGSAGSQTCSARTWTARTTGCWPRNPTPGLDPSPLKWSVCPATHGRRTSF